MLFLNNKSKEESEEECDSDRGRPSCDELIEKRKQEAKDKEIRKKVKKIVSTYGEKNIRNLRHQKVVREIYDDKEIKLRKKVRISTNNGDSYIGGGRYKKEEIKVFYKREEVFKWVGKSHSTNVAKYRKEEEWLNQLEKLYKEALKEEKKEKYERKRKRLKEKWGIDIEDCKVCL